MPPLAVQLDNARARHGFWLDPSRVEGWLRLKLLADRVRYFRTVYAELGPDPSWEKDRASDAMHDEERDFTNYARDLRIRIRATVALAVASRNVERASIGRAA